MVGVRLKDSIPVQNGNGDESKIFTVSGERRPVSGERKFRRSGSRADGFPCKLFAGCVAGNGGEFSGSLSDVVPGQPEL